MYIPREYREQDQGTIVAFMKRYNFAIVVTDNDGVPVATHLPFHVHEQDGNIVLSAHFARANPQWKSIASKEVLVIFSQPHAYISPTHYDREQSVPTWNYMAVHAYGKCRVIEDPAGGMKVLEDMILQSEPGYKDKWDNLSTDYKSALYKGIVPERSRIADTLANHEDTAARNVAEYMQQQQHEE
jgi:transcriptional regulator